MSQPQLQTEEEDITICAIPAPMLHVKAVLSDGTSASVVDRIGSYLWRGCKHSSGQQSPQSLMSACDRGEYLLLLSLRGDEILGCAVVSQMVFGTGKRSLFINLVSGREFPLWMRPMLDEIERLAKSYECGSVLAAGRAGWIRRWSKDAGYNQVHTTFERELED